MLERPNASAFLQQNPGALAVFCKTFLVARELFLNSKTINQILRHIL